MTTPTTTTLRTHTLHNGNIVTLTTDGTTLTATLVDGGLVETRFKAVKLGEGVAANEAAFWLRMVEMATKGGG